MIEEGDAVGSEPAVHARDGDPGVAGGRSDISWVTRQAAGHLFHLVKSVVLYHRFVANLMSV